jgi:hypothetical protein
MNEETEKIYQPPTLTVHGDVESITLNNITGGHTDRTFPALTPFSDLTFS